MAAGRRNRPSRRASFKHICTPKGLDVWSWLVAQHCSRCFKPDPRMVGPAQASRPSHLPRPRPLRSVVAQPSRRAAQHAGVGRRRDRCHVPGRSSCWVQRADISPIHWFRPTLCRRARAPAPGSCTAGRHASVGSGVSLSGYNGRGTFPRAVVPSGDCLWPSAALARPMLSL